MEKTINYTEVGNFWNGKVVIRELKKYTDERGMVAEIFRTDSDLNFDSKMCYISDTNPLVLRGPHEHKDQKDVFISWGDNARMIYQMYNPAEPQEVKYFVTEPNKIYSVTVERGIIHSYRNISATPIKTLNFPDQLYKGLDKKSEIDEIRHEDKITPTHNIWIFGAGGRLGNAFVKSLFKNMGYHKYHVIPIYEKFENNKDGLKKLNDTLEEIAKNKNNIIVNCIAKTNVHDEKSDFNYENFLLPKFLSEFCVKQKIHIVNFSTDYIYQTGAISPYTRSKILFETWLATALEDENMWGYLLSDIKKYIKVIRVANLFSKDKEDTRTLINKIFAKIKEGGITIPKDLTIMPTSVEALSQFIIDTYLFEIDGKNQVVEISGKAYNFFEFKNKFFGDMKCDIKENEHAKVKNNTELFLNNDYYQEIDCDSDIIEKLQTIKDENGR